MRKTNRHQFVDNRQNLTGDSEDCLFYWSRFMQFSPPGDSCQEIQGFLTAQDNSRSYQGFQEITGICGKIQDVGKSFKIFYTGLFQRSVTKQL